MSGRAPQAMRRRDESAHPVIQDAHAKGYLGTEQVYPIDGFTSHEAANQGRLSVNRGLRHLGFSPAAWVVDQYGQECYRACKAPEAPHGVRFRLWTKEQGRRHVLETTGGDPAKLKYNPFRKADPPLVDDYGRAI